MQFLRIKEDTTLSQLSDRVGSRNVDNILNLHSLERTPQIGKAYKELMDRVLLQSQPVSYQRKQAILNTCVADADVFETVALFGDDEWKIMASLDTLPWMLRIPDRITLPDSVDMLGGTGNPIGKMTYTRAMDYLRSHREIDPVIFNQYSTVSASQIITAESHSSPIQWFELPWGKVSLFSSLSGQSMDFPVYPKGFDDGVQANYETMPELLYQYEPWQIYRSSGPRTITYDFDMHRDMWTGDHRDGKCNALIRFCQANCYPKYQGASVQTPTVTLYIAGKKHITGVMTSARVSWDNDSPIGEDGFYLHLVLSLSITEVSDVALNYDTVQKKELIG